MLILGLLLLIPASLLAVFGVLVMLFGEDPDRSHRIVVGLFLLIPGLAIAAGGLAAILQSDREASRDR